MNRLLHFTDTELWNAFRQGNEEAYAYLYRKFSPILYSYGYHLCRNRDQTEDCMQDLFVHLHQHRSQLGETDSTKFYLYRSLRRRIAEKAQANSRWVWDEEHTARPEFELGMPAEAGLVDEQTAYYKAVKSGSLVWNDRKYAFPIPQTELLNNPNMKQNPGY